MDFYKALGLSRGASKQEVRDAWRKRALENHPDRHAPSSMESLSHTAILLCCKFCEREPLRAASLISLRACRHQGASEVEKGEALRKFNHAKEAYEVLIDGTYIGLLSTTISLPSANHLIPWPMKRLSGLPLEMNVVLSWGIAEAAVDMRPRLYLLWTPACRVQARIV